MIWNLRAALHLDLERFYDQLGSAVPSPDPSAFTRARAFLKASAFRDLNDQLIGIAEVFGLRNHTWNGLRLLAVDGSTLRLPKASPNIASYFGGATSSHGTFLPMARISYLYEVRTGLIIDARISPYKEGEWAQALDLIGGKVWNNDCVLYDRGYNDSNIIAMSLAQGSHFVIRVAVGNSKAAQDFVESGLAEREFEFQFKSSLIEEFEVYGLTIPQATRLRFVRVVLDAGEIEVLVTNLLDARLYPAEEFKELYHERWGVEEGFKTTKCKIEIENWTGKSVASIKQDFHARVLCQNIAASLAQATQPKLDKDTACCRGVYIINVKRAIGVIRDRFCAIMTASAEQIRQIFEILSERLCKSACIVRKGRSFPRGTPRRIPAAMPYKPVI